MATVPGKFLIGAGFVISLMQQCRHPSVAHALSFANRNDMSSERRSMMKKTIAALILAAAAAAPPAMAQTYVYSNGMSAQAQVAPSYGMYSSDIRQWDLRIINPTFAQDPDPNVRIQLQNQSDLIDR